MRRRFLASLVVLMPCLASAADPAIVVLDASGSMWGRMGERAKIEIAREAIANTLRDWPADRPLGLVAYGHRSKSDCADIQTVLPVGPFDRARTVAAVNALQPKGMTPIGDSLRAASKALVDAGASAGNTIVLVSDGEETCKVDPCAVARELKRNQSRLIVHVVGFDLGQSIARQQLSCVAQATGGRYFDASDAQGLGRALSAAVYATVRGVAPKAAATLIWQGSAPLAGQIDVSFTGPADPLDYIAFAKPGAPDDSYADAAFSAQLSAGAPARVSTPTTPGRYELRYVSPVREPRVLARLPVDVVAASISVRPRAERVAPGAEVIVDYDGPRGENVWLGFVARGGDASTRQYIAYAVDPGPVTLFAPDQPGDYDVAVVMPVNGADTVRARAPVQVVP